MNTCRNIINYWCTQEIDVALGGGGSGGSGGSGGGGGSGDGGSVAWC